MNLETSRFHSAETCSKIPGWETPSCITLPKTQNIVDKITVLVHSVFAGDPVSRKSTTRFVAQIGSHTLKSRSFLQSLTALSGGAEFYAVVKGSPVRLSSRSIYMDVGIPMNAEVQSGSSTRNSLTGRLGAGPRTKHIDTR